MHMCIIIEMRTKPLDDLFLNKKKLSNFIILLVYPIKTQLCFIAKNFMLVQLLPRSRDHMDLAI